MTGPGSIRGNRRFYFLSYLKPAQCKSDLFIQSTFLLSICVRLCEYYLCLFLSFFLSSFVFPSLCLYFIISSFVSFFLSFCLFIYIPPHSFLVSLCLLSVSQFICLLFRVSFVIFHFGPPKGLPWVKQSKRLLSFIPLRTKVKMRGSLPPRLLYAFIIWYLDKGTALNNDQYGFWQCWLPSSVLVPNLLSVAYVAVLKFNTPVRLTPCPAVYSMFQYPSHQATRVFRFCPPFIPISFLITVSSLQNPRR